jgi:hypothetical protein
MCFWYKGQDQNNSELSVDKKINPKEEIKVKRINSFPLVLTFVFILGLYGVAAGGGGEPGQGCPATMPPATSGPFLYGTFTVAQDKSEASLYSELAGYDLHIGLQYKLIKHLFSSFILGLDQRGLCGVEDSELETLYAKLPCVLGIGEAFGFDPAQYIPVIKDLHIIKQDFCGTTDAMIEGIVIIRLVPLVPPKPPRH